MSCENHEGLSEALGTGHLTHSSMASNRDTIARVSRQSSIVIYICSNFRSSQDKETFMDLLSRKKVA